MNALLLTLILLVQAAALAVLFTILHTLETYRAPPEPLAPPAPAPKRKPGRKPKPAPSSSPEPVDPRQIAIEEPK